MTINGGGRELLETVGALLDDPRRDAIMAVAERTVEWIEDGARGRRSVNNLARGSAVERKQFSSVADADPIAIDVALMRAQREISDEPLTMRIGVNDISKQARNTDDVWLSNEIDRQRGAISRCREGRLMIVSSKNAGSPTLPGATAVVKRGEHPDAAVSRVLRSIRKADPDARILNVELDAFDACVAKMRRKTDVPPFTFRVPDLMARERFTGPTALFLGMEPRISSIAVDGGVRDVSGLRVGLRGRWSDPYPAEIEVPGADGRSVEREPVSVRVSDEVRFDTKPRSFRARVARVVADPREGVRLPTEPKLVAVLGLNDTEALVELAVTALSATDEHPDVAEYIDMRTAARVFRGEQETRQALHVDRAIASIAVAVHMLDKQAVGA